MRKDVLSLAWPNGRGKRVICQWQLPLFARVCHGVSRHVEYNLCCLAARVLFRGSKTTRLEIGLLWTHEVEVDVQVILLHHCAKPRRTNTANIFCYTRKEEKSAIEAAGILRCESLETTELPPGATMKSRWCGIPNQKTDWNTADTFEQVTISLVVCEVDGLDRTIFSWTFS